MDGFVFTLLCLVAICALVPLLIHLADRALDRLFSHDDAYLAGLTKAQRELDQRKRINKPTN